MDQCVSALVPANEKSSSNYHYGRCGPHCVRFGRLFSHVPAVLSALLQGAGAGHAFGDRYDTASISLRSEVARLPSLTPPPLHK